MRHYYLTITSKTKKSINDFFVFLNNTFITFHIIRKYFKHKKTKKFFTILKSPHVNKTAQEQFESNFFSSQITIYDRFQSLIFLKKIKNNLFPAIKIKLHFPISKKVLKKKQLQILNPNNYKLQLLQKNLNQKTRIKKYQKKSYKQIKHLLQIFDVYGELLQKLSLDSSVGRAKD
jgi:ribosomal protein S10